MQITLPDHPDLRNRAKAAGFTSVEEYVRRLVERDVEQGSLQLPSPPQSAEDWVRDFRAFIQSIPPGNPYFDDSRESMYPIR